MLSCVLCRGYGMVVRDKPHPPFWRNTPATVSGLARFRKTLSDGKKFIAQCHLFVER
jgi:hypothetical protein